MEKFSWQRSPSSSPPRWTATRRQRPARQTAHFVLELEDLLKEIFRHLDLGVDARAMRVCRQWRRVLAAAVASRLTLTLDDYVAGDSTGLSLPHGVGMMPRHYEGMARLLVADTRNDRLVAFTAGEKLCREIECPEIMVRPRTLTLTDEDLYITSFTQNNIIRIRYDDILTRNAERAPNCADVVSTEGDLWSPEGVCIHRGRLYAARPSHEVSYTLQEETPLPVKHRFGADRLRDPTGLAWHAGCLYVADRGQTGCDLLVECWHVPPRDPRLPPARRRRVPPRPHVRLRAAARRRDGAGGRRAARRVQRAELLPRAPLRRPSARLRRRLPQPRRPPAGGVARRGGCRGAA